MNNGQKPKFVLDKMTKREENTARGRYLKAISEAKIDFRIRVAKALDKHQGLTDDDKSRLMEDIEWEMETLLDDFERARNEHTSPPLKKKDVS